MKQLLTTIALLMSLSVFAQTANDYFKDGNQNYDYGDYNAAIESYTKALEIEENPAIYYNRANAKSALKDYVGAIKDYTESLKRDTESYIKDSKGSLIPDTAIYKSFFGRAECKFMLNDYYGAIYDCNKAIKLYPRLDRIFIWRGKSYLSLSKFSLAIKDFTKAISLNPDNGESYYWRAFAKLSGDNPNFDQEGGCLDFSKAGELGYTRAYEMIRKHCNSSGGN